MTQNAPLDLSSSRNQTLLDFSGICQWQKIKKDLRLQWDFKRFPHDELADRTQEFLNAVEQESKMGYNQYIIVTASRLGSGKSESALWLCWMFDKEFSIENCLVYNLPQVARIVQRRKRDFWMAFDEPQEELASINWMNLPDSTKRFIVTQRENHINIVYATPNIQRLWYVIKDNYNYNLHITYRCMPSPTNQGHVHGIIYTRSGNPNDSGEFTVWGTFTIPKPSDPFLVAEIKRYHDQFKADFMEDSREELIVDELEGGRMPQYADRFFQWFLKQNLRNKKGELMRPAKIQVKLWVDELRKNGEDLILSDPEQGELCGYARNMWYSGGYAETKSEAAS